MGELPAGIQSKLLRVLEDRQVRRVGSLTARTVDVRFVAATSRDLEAAVAVGAFRPDLYFRLNGYSLRVPPLRDRPSEIPHLARAFAEDTAREIGLAAAPEISGAAMTRLLRHAWPGNVRELRNVLGRAVLLSGGVTLEPEHLGLEIPDAAQPLRDPASDERARIIDALVRCHGNQTRAARLLGIARRTLISKMERYNLPRPRKP